MTYTNSFVLLAFFHESDGLLTNDSAIIASLMTQFNFTQEAPLWMDPDGTVRFKGSRVTLDTLVGAFLGGDTVEEIHDSFPTLSIRQIYGGIAWYLNNQAEADEYLKQREVAAAAIEREIRERFDHAAFRELLLKRRAQLRKN